MRRPGDWGRRAVARCLLPLVVAASGCGGHDRITVASKNFTESVILGEIVAQQLERHGLAVDRRLNLGGTFICHEALVVGQADVYVEYSGTAHLAILRLPTVRDRDVVRRQVDSAYLERWDLVWTEPLGFENTFALLIRGAEARRLGISTLSQAAAYAPRWRPGWGYEFSERADGSRGLADAYGLRFAAPPAIMDLGLMYRALADQRVDIVAGNSTDGQIAALDLFHLRDDRRYFPPYEAAPIVRRKVLEEHPQIRAALAALGGTIDEGAMRQMNYLVDVEKRAVREVAREFVEELARRPRSAVSDP